MHAWQLGVGVALILSALRRVRDNDEIDGFYAMVWTATLFAAGSVLAVCGYSWLPCAQ